LLCSTAAAATPPPVELTLTTPQTSYVLGDRIPVSLIIRPVASSATLEYRQDLIGDFAGNFTVTGPSGAKLRRLSDSTIHVSVDAWVVITNGGSIVKSADLTDIYGEPYEIPAPHSFNATGVYEVTYEAVTAVRVPGGSDGRWEGRLRSQPLTIALVEPDQPALDAAYGAVAAESTNKLARLRALDRIRFSKTSLSPQEVNLLSKVFSGTDQETKIRVIRALGAKTSMKCVEAIADILRTEMDPYVRSEAMAALGHSETAEARRLVLEECQSRRERSYRAAVVVLGWIGDNSCTNALHQIAVTDDTDWVRERATESIGKIEDRLKRAGVPSIGHWSIDP
jgi:hypothetical protein